MFVFMFIAISAIAQERTITGTVTSQEDGLAIPGVSVKVKGTRIGAVTDASGKYSIKLPAGATALEFSFVGFTTTSKTVGNSGLLNVALLSDATALTDVVVVGYQSVRRQDLVGNVSSVQSKEIAQKPIASIAQGLQGTATGVQVTGTSGRPGANAYIKIRGVGSINGGTEPLIIVDGVQVNTAAYNGINPNDVEEISILKDAASSAIYGSRAANGVIVIRTKSGKQGEPVLRYSFQYGKSEIQKLKNVQLMNSAEKLQYEYELGYTNPLVQAQIPGANDNVTTITPALRQSIWNDLISKGAGDWADYLFQKGTLKTHEISLSGADNKFKYFFSANSNSNEGTEINSSFNRKGGRINLEYQAKEWFKMGVNLGATQSKEVQVREPFNTQNLYASYFLYNPYEPVYNADGTYNTTFQGFSSIEGSINNPAIIDRLNTFGTIYGEAKFLKHLTLRSQIGGNYNTFKSEAYTKGGSNLAAILGYSQKTDQGNQDLFYTWTNTANWNQTFGGKHNLNVLAGTEFSKDNLYSYLLTARNFPTASVETLENASTPITTTTSRNQYALISYLASANYNYDGKYYLTGSVRRDGSSRFGANNKYANFYAGGFSWNIKKEDFFKADWVSALSLRGSVGTTGNNNIGNYDALGVYQLNVKYKDLPAASPFRLPNPDLTWEQSLQYDISTNFGFLDGRISGELGYYIRKTSNLLYPVNVSTTTGFASYQGNVGKMQNSGIEAALTGVIVRDKDWNVSLSVSYSSVKNKITELYSDNATAPNTSSYGKLVVGQPMNTYFLVNWAGVNPANGKNQYYNIDGSVTETYSSSQAQLQIGKSPVPTYFGTIGADVKYKDFDLSARIYYTGGNYIFNVMDQVGASEGENVNNNQYTSAFDYWKKPGDIVRYANPLDPTQTATQDSNKYLEKGDYVSLRDVTLGYTLPVKYAKYIKSSGIRLFVQGTNLALWTKFKGTPEIGESSRERTEFPGVFGLYAYPPLKAYTFGLDIRF